MIPQIAEASSRKYPYEVLIRSLHKLLMDTASSEYTLDFVVIDIIVKCQSILSDFKLSPDICILIFSFLIIQVSFCDDFFGEESIFYEIFAGTDVAVIPSH